MGGREETKIALICIHVYVFSNLIIHIYRFIALYRNKGAKCWVGHAFNLMRSPMVSDPSAHQVQKK